MSSGVAWMEVALARASMTLSRMSFSAATAPFTDVDQIGHQISAALILIEHL